MARVKTFVNGGSLLPADLNSIEDDFEYTFSTYKTVVDPVAYRFDAPTAATYVLVDSVGGTGVAATAATAGLGVFYLDPAWATSNTRTNYYRVHSSCLVNATAPTVNFTVGLYPVSTPAGGAATVSFTLGTVVSGSTTAFNAPASGSSAVANSGDFAAPAAGYYCLACVVSGAAAASSAVAICARVQFRQV